ncbi:MAG: hypothetical protein K9I74_12235 [Bacteroidales bacterium]|nr:hypothetical protein [Bacteroidales bacterium]
MRNLTLEKLLTSRNFILVLGITLGLIFGEEVAFLENYTPYIIGAILAVSISSLRFRELLPLKKNLKPIGVTVLVNYFIYGAIVLTLANLFISSEAFKLGFVVIAATPPAIAVIPFSINLKGDAQFSIVGIVGGNIAGIVLAPVIIMIFSAQGAIDPMAVVTLILKMLAVPMLVSRLLRIKPVHGFIEKHRSILIDYGFLLVAMTVIGITRSLLFNNTLEAIIPFLIVVFMMFGLGYLFQVYLNARRIDPHLIISNKLILVMKNAGFASVMAMGLFEDPHVVLPSAILSVMLPVYYLVQSNIDLLNNLKRIQKKRVAMEAK